MLVFDLYKIGEKLYLIRKRMGMTQADVAEAADLSERIYADIERGSANMRVETILRICDVLHITPDAIFTEENTSFELRYKELTKMFNACSPKEKETAIKLLTTYLKSLK